MEILKNKKFKLLGLFILTLINISQNNGNESILLDDI